MFVSSIRWIGALVAAAVAYVVVVLLMSISWSHFGGDATEAVKHMHMLAAASSVWAAVAVVPVRHWRAAAYMVSTFLIACEGYGFVSSLVTETAKPLGVFSLFSTVFGCFGMLYLLQIRMRSG